jgi:hypothetical protein
MPSSADQHRCAIGRFYFVQMGILEKSLRNKRSRMAQEEVASKMRHKCSTCSFKAEVGSWLSGVTLSLAYCLFILLLTQSMDVELNPGPCSTECQNTLWELKQTMDVRFSQIFHFMFHNTSSIHKRLEDQLSRFESSLFQLKEDITNLIQTTHVSRSDIECLLSSHDQTSRRLARMEQDIERMEVFSRQANLKFIGIREDNLDGVSSVDKVVHLLNNH